MDKISRILHLEDDDDDAELIKRKLENSGLACQITRVRFESEFVAAVGKLNFDLILSNFSIPSYDGYSALAHAKEMAPHIPFIFVSDIMGEDALIESLVNGATDYVLKAGDLKRLIPAIRRALREAEERKDRRKLEDQYRHAQKMEAVGRLAGGVAHDFNNLLTAILGLSELSLRDLPPASPIRKDLEEVVATTLRAGELTKQLLAFSRKQIVEPQVINLNDLINNIQKMLKRIIGEDIELVFQPATGLETVRIDPGQMEQLIFNLAVNARDAMLNGGKLLIETSNVSMEHDFVSRNPGASIGRFVRMDIKDTGAGMTDEAKAHLFEPFYTTKEQGKGTGLGLPTCYGIVKQNGGYISVVSAVGEGTVVSIYLPQASGKTHPIVKRDSIKTSQGTETVLLVEDEASVRRLAVRVLGNQGYRVLEAADGEKALNIIQDDGERHIRLVMTDVVMPKFGGRQLAEKIRPLRPDIKILFTSGYTGEAISRQGILETGIKFIPKPFSPDDLARKVREVLDT